MAIELGNSALAFLFIVIGLFLSIKLIPKTVKKKIIAWALSKLMWRVHLKCGHHKQDLFRSLEDLPRNKRATPKVLEIGVGTGSNFAFYPEQCTVTCQDPNLEGRPYVVEAALQYPGIKIDKFLEGFAENMSKLDDNAFDAVVCTFVLCSVREPQKALSEIKRVLKPGGSFLFMEHVAAARSSKTYLVQHLLGYLWTVLAGGCHLTRETWTLIEEAGFSDVDLKHFAIDGLSLFFVRPSIYGVAVK